MTTTKCDFVLELSSIYAYFYFSLSHFSNYFYDFFSRVSQLQYHSQSIFLLIKNKKTKNKARHLPTRSEKYDGDQSYPGQRRYNHRRIRRRHRRHQPNPAAASAAGNGRTVVILVVPEEHRE
jgi:hypothetical protein